MEREIKEAEHGKNTGVINREIKQNQPGHLNVEDEGNQADQRSRELSEGRLSNEQNTFMVQSRSNQSQNPESDETDSRTSHYYSQLSSLSQQTAPDYLRAGLRAGLRANDSSGTNNGLESLPQVEDQGKSNQGGELSNRFPGESCSDSKQEQTFLHKNINPQHSQAEEALSFTETELIAIQKYQKEQISLQRLKNP